MDVESVTIDIKLIVQKKLLKISVAEMFSEQKINSTIANNATNSSNIGPQYISKDLPDKISELYERSIEIKKQ